MRTAAVDVLAGALQGRGAFGRIEASVHPVDHLGLFAFGAFDSSIGWSVGGGARVEFRF